MNKPSTFECARAAVEAEERLLEILMGLATDGQDARDDQDDSLSVEEADDVRKPA